MRSYQLLPDVGKVLGDETLAEFDIMDIFGSGVVDEKEGNYRRLLVVDDDEPFDDEKGGDAPRSTHLCLNTPIVHLESLKHCLSTSVSALFVGNIVFAQVLDWLFDFLRNQPPESPLRTLVLPRSSFFPERLMEKFLDAFLNVNSTCKVENLLLHYHVENCARPLEQDAQELGRRCRSLILYLRGRHAHIAHLLPHFGSGLLQCLSVHLSGAADETDASALAKILTLEICNLKRLSFFEPLSAQVMESLLRSVASPSCSLQDLGIDLGYTDQEEEQENSDSKACFSALVQAFKESSSLSRIKVLRFDNVDTEQAARCVVDILASANCKVRFLEISMFPSDSSNYNFFSELQCQAKACNIQCLRIFIFTNQRSSQDRLLADLAGFLRWEDCPLLWLHCMRTTSFRTEQSVQLQLANSLEHNYNLNYLQFDGWSSTDAAFYRAAAFLRRNRLYKAAGLDSKEQRSKPQVGRLFICGHGEVGKTTIRKALMKLNQHTSCRVAVANCIQHTYNKFSSCRCPNAQEAGEPRTRGLEMHQLCFPPDDQKLVIVDLAGQADYHVFHHYFMSNTSNDMFMVVCKHDPSTQAVSEIESQLLYCLRFIVSHRNTVHGPQPKVLLLLNFFSTDSNMQDTAKDIIMSTQLVNKYSEVLNFGNPPDVFGINARNTADIKLILEKLGMLLPILLKDMPMLPKVCNELQSSILPQLQRSEEDRNRQFTCGMRLPSSRTQCPILSYESLKQFYLHEHNQTSSEHDRSMLERRIELALVCMHNVCEVIFFPPSTDVSTHGASTSSEIPSNLNQQHLGAQEATPVITQPNWFCNKVVGDLLAPEDLQFRGSFKRKPLDVRQIIRHTGCSSKYLDAMLRYIEALDLCFSTKVEDQGAFTDMFFFPAVAKDKMSSWPSQFPDGSSSSIMKNFYGRRLKCKDTDKQLIPFGIFTRLQAQLFRFCGATNEQSYRMGYRWSSFVKDSIVVVLKFGGTMDDYPEWIDIFICSEASGNWGSSSSLDMSSDGISTAATGCREDAVMGGIKRLIFEICQATSRGIPTVELEEWVMRDTGAGEAGVCPLATIEKALQREGIGGTVSWKDQRSTPLVDLLLPNELKRHIMTNVQAMEKVQNEFEFTSDFIISHDLQGHMKEQEADYQLEGQTQVLYKMLCDHMAEQFGMLQAQVKDVLVLVQGIKRDVGKLLDGLNQMQVNIVANCSTRLLTQLYAIKDGHRPAYPYLTDTSGKMKKLKTLVLQREAILHFLCESPRDGPHKVEGQEGLVVVLEEGILKKAAPFLVPALRVVCCAAKIVANVCLPGIPTPPFFNPLQECLQPLHITARDLQSAVMSKALDILFDDIDVGIEKFDRYSKLPKLDQEKLTDGLGAFQTMLGDMEDLDMERHFGLHLVQANQLPATKLLWVCEEHANKPYYTKIQSRRPKPFS